MSKPIFPGGGRGGRIRGSGRGSLYVAGKHPQWYGEWREYRFQEDGTEKAHHRKIALGSPSEVSQAEARAAFDKILAKDNGLVPFPAHTKTRDAAGLNAAYAECIVAADLLRQGYELYKPFNASCRHDLLAHRDGEYKRVEVKMGEIGVQGYPNIDMASKVGRFEILALVSRKGTIVYRTHNEAIDPRIHSITFHSMDAKSQ